MSAQSKRTSAELSKNVLASLKEVEDHSSSTDGAQLVHKVKIFESMSNALNRTYDTPTSPDGQRLPYRLARTSSELYATDPTPLNPAQSTPKSLPFRGRGNSLSKRDSKRKFFVAHHAKILETEFTNMFELREAPVCRDAKRDEKTKKKQSEMKNSCDLEAALINCSGAIIPCDDACNEAEAEPGTCAQGLTSRRRLSSVSALPQGVFRELKAIQKQRNSLCAAENTGGHDVDDKWAAAHGNLPATHATHATHAVEAQISARVMRMSLTALYRDCKERGIVPLKVMRPCFRHTGVNQFRVHPSLQSDESLVQRH